MHFQGGGSQTWVSWASIFFYLALELSCSGQTKDSNAKQCATCGRNEELILILLEYSLRDLTWGHNINMDLK
jgi:hypothetical protein